MMSKDAVSKQRQYKEVAKRKIDEIVGSRTFETCKSDAPQRRFFIFRYTGDSLEGILGPPRTNWRRNTSYPLELDDGTTVEFFGNKLLHDIIRKNELVGSRIKIVYIGKQAGPWGRPRKIFRVYKDKGVFTPCLERQTSKKYKIHPSQIIQES